MAEVRSGPAHVLFVCTGNVCRSPMAERLMLGGLEHRRVRGVDVTSAGTHALVGSPMTPPSAELVDELGGARLPHSARQITREMALDADLVVVLTRQQRSEVVTMAPGVLRRSFTLREIERLLSGIDADRLAGLPVGAPDRVRALALLLLSSRGPVADPLADDVVDPYGGSRSRYRRSADEIAPAVAVLVDVIAGAGAGADLDPDHDPETLDPDHDPQTLDDAVLDDAVLDDTDPADADPDGADPADTEPDDAVLDDADPAEVGPDGADPADADADAAESEAARTDAAGTPVTDTAGADVNVTDAGPVEVGELQERRGTQRRSWLRQGWERRRGGRERRT